MAYEVEAVTVLKSRIEPTDSLALAVTRFLRQVPDGNLIDIQYLSTATKITAMITYKK